jgi:hypothetical protein
MLVQVAVAGALVTAGAALGVLLQRYREAYKRVKRVLTRRPADPEPTFDSWLVITKMRDPKDGGPVTPAAELTLLLRPDPRK